MKINILVTGIELTPAISDYVNKKISSIEKFLDKSNQDIVAQIEIGRTTEHHKSGEVYKAEVHVTGGGLDLYAVVEKDDLYAAIDEVKDEMSRELRRQKGKRSALARRGEQMMKSAMKGFSWSLSRIKGFRKKGDEETEI